MEEAALLSMSFWLWLVLKLEVGSVVWISSQSLFGDHFISDSRTNRRMTNNFCNIIRTPHINCFQEMRVFKSLNYIGIILNCHFFVGNRMVEGQQLYMAQHNLYKGKGIDSIL